VAIDFIKKHNKMARNSKIVGIEKIISKKGVVKWRARTRINGKSKSKDFWNWFEEHKS
jgi:hypothetical protein